MINCLLKAGVHNFYCHAHPPETFAGQPALNKQKAKNDKNYHLWLIYKLRRKLTSMRILLIANTQILAEAKF